MINRKKEINLEQVKIIFILYFHKLINRGIK